MFQIVVDAHQLLCTGGDRVCAEKGKGMGWSLKGHTWGNPKPISDPTVKTMMAYFYAHSTGVFTDRAIALGENAVRMTARAECNHSCASISLNFAASLLLSLPQSGPSSRRRPVTDIITLYLLPDDAPAQCAHFYCSAAGSADSTEVYVVPREQPSHSTLRHLSSSLCRNPAPRHAAGPLVFQGFSGA